MLEKTRL
ncbi:dc59178f-dac5-46b4-98c4-0c161444c7bc [Thermothielavioides terrestris]|nr:dc59178f-dac5-46b4-98c4-0c161444c7bc [Thermothielavioides terrestris]